MRRGYSPLQRFVVTVVKPTLLALTKRDWRGQEHVPPTGGMILAANHLSWTDPMAISHFLYESGRWPVFLAKSELFAVPVLGTLIHNIGQIPVYRHSTDAGHALRDAERGLIEGACVIFYPEGTCTRDPELWPMTGKTGAARLAITTGVPVIPLAHWGPHELLPYGEKRPRLFPRKTMRLAAGPAVDLSAYRGEALTAHNLRAASDEITSAVAGLLAGLRGQQPPPGPYDPRTGRYAAAADRSSSAVPGGAAAPGQLTAESSRSDGAAGHHAAGDHAAGDHAAGDHAAGDHAAGDHAAGDHAAGDHTAGDHTAGGGRGSA